MHHVSSSSLLSHGGTTPRLKMTYGQTTKLFASGLIFLMILLMEIEYFKKEAPIYCDIPYFIVIHSIFYLSLVYLCYQLSYIVIQYNKYLYRQLFVGIDLVIIFLYFCIWCYSIRMINESGCQDNMNGKESAILCKQAHFVIKAYVILGGTLLAGFGCVVGYFIWKKLSKQDLEED